MRDDAMLCRRCGKMFPLSADGESLLRAHVLAESAIDSAAKSASVRDTHEAVRQLPLPFGHGSDVVPDPLTSEPVDEELF